MWVGGKNKKLRLVDVVEFKVCKLWGMCILEKVTIEDNLKFLLLEIAIYSRLI